MANVKQTYTLEVIAKGLKEVTSEIRGLRADMARVPGATDKAEKGYRKVTKSVGEYDRNAKGAANATNNSTKAFSKMAQGMSGTLVPAYATVAANVFALTAAFGALERAMDTQILINASEELATQTGRSLTMLADSMKDITGNAISMKEALQSASIAASAGFDNTTIERLTQVARNASVALGRDMTDSLNRVFKGAIKAEPELLDELGIILRLDPATREYAASLGKAASELTTFEKQQAVVNAVLEQGEDKFGRLSEVDPNPYTQLAAAFQDVANSLLYLVNIPIAPVISFFSENTEALTAALIIFSTSVLKRAIPALTGLGEAFTEIGSKKLTGLKNTVEGFEVFRDVISDKSFIQSGTKMIDALIDIDNQMDRFDGSLNKHTKSIRESYEKIYYDPKLSTEQKITEINKILSAGAKELGENYTIAGSKLEESYDAMTAGSIRARIVTSDSFKLMTSVLLAFEKVVGKKVVDSVLKLGLSLKALSVGTVSTFLAGFSGDFSKVSETLQNLEKDLKNAEGSLVFFNRGILAASKAAGILGFALQGLLKAIPILGQLYIAWEILGGIVSKVLGLFRDNKAIEDTNKALENQVDTLDTAEKTIARYNKELKNAPKTLENLSKSLEVQRNVLLELNNANQELIDNQQGFNEFLGSDIDDLTDNLNRQLDILRDLGKETEVNRILKEFGENEKIIAENAVNAQIQVSKLTDTFYTSADAAKEANKFISETINTLNDSFKNLQSSLPKLTPLQNIFVSITTTLEAIEGLSVINQLEILSQLSNFGTTASGTKEAVKNVQDITVAYNYLSNQIAKGTAKQEEFEEAVTKDVVPTGIIEFFKGITEIFSVKDLVDQFNDASRDTSVLLEALEDVEEGGVQAIDSIKESFNTYRKEVEISIGIQEKLNKKIQELNFLVNLPGTSIEERVGLFGEIAEADISILENIRKTAEDSVGSTETLLIAAKKQLQNFYAALDPDTDLAAPENTQLLQTQLQLVRNLRDEQTKYFQIQNLASETEAKINKVRINQLNTYFKELQKLGKLENLGLQVEKGDITVISLVEKIRPVLQDLGVSFETLRANTKEWTDETVNALLASVEFANVIDLAGTSEQLAKNNIARKDLIKSYQFESTYLKENNSDLDDRIDKEAIIGIARVNSLMDLNIAAQILAAQRGDLEALIALEEHRELLLEEQNQWHTISAEQITRAHNERIAALNIELNQRQQEAKLGRELTKKEQLNLDLAKEAQKLWTQGLRGDELREELELLDEINKEILKADFDIQVNSNLPDIVNELSDTFLRLNENIENSENTMQKFQSSFVAAIEISRAFGDENGEAIGQIGLSIAKFGEEFNKVGASTKEIANAAGDALVGVGAAIQQAAGENEDAAKAGAYIQGVGAVIKAWNSAPPPWNIPAIAATVAGVNQLLSSIEAKSVQSKGAAQATQFKESFGAQGVQNVDLQTNTLAESMDRLVDVNDDLFGSQRKLRDAINGLKQTFASASAGIFKQFGTFKIGDISKLFNIEFGTEVSGGFLGLFSDSESKELLASGIQLASSIELIGEKLAGSIDEAVGYVTFQITEIDSGLFGTDTDIDIKTKTRKLNDSVINQLQGSLNYTIDTIILLLDDLGINIDKALNNFEGLEFDLTKLNLTDLSPDQVADTIAAYFTSIGIELVDQLTPGLINLSEYGEASLDVLVRLAEAAANFTNVFEQIGMTIEDFVGVQAVGVEAAYDSFKAEELARQAAIEEQINADIALLESYYNTSGKAARKAAEQVIKNELEFLNDETFDLRAGKGKKFRADIDKYLESLNISLDDLANESIKSFEDFTAYLQLEWIDSLEKQFTDIDEFNTLFEKFSKSVFSDDEIAENLAVAAGNQVEKGLEKIAEYIGADRLTELLGLDSLDLGDTFENFEDIIPALDIRALFEALEKTGDLLDTELYAELIRLGAGVTDFTDYLTEAEDAIANFNKDIERQIALFGLVGKELDLLQLSFDFEDAVNEAIKSGGDIVLVEELYGLKRLDIIRSYNQEIIDLFEDARTSISDAITDIRRQMEGWDEVEFQTNRLEDLWLELIPDAAQVKKITSNFSKNISSVLEDGLVNPLENITEIINSELTTTEQIELIGEIRDATLDLYNAQLSQIEGLKDAASGISDYLDDLILSDLSPLTNAERLAEAQNQFGRDLLLAKEGDIEAANRLTSSADTLLTLGSEFFGTSQAYQDIFNDVTTALSNIQTDITTGLTDDAVAITALQEKTITQLETLDTILSALETQNEEDYATEVANAIADIGGGATLQNIVDKLDSLDPDVWGDTIAAILAVSSQEAEALLTTLTTTRTEDSSAIDEAAEALISSAQAFLDASQESNTDLINLTDNLISVDEFNSIFSEIKKLLDSGIIEYEDIDTTEEIIKLTDTLKTIIDDKYTSADYIYSITGGSTLFDIVTRLDTLIYSLPRIDTEPVFSISEYQSGSPEIEFDQIAKVHQGEMILTPETSEQVRTGEAIVTNIDNTSNTINNQTTEGDYSANVVAALEAIIQLLADGQEEIIINTRRMANNTEVRSYNTANTTGIV